MRARAAPGNRTGALGTRVSALRTQRSWRFEERFKPGSLLNGR